MKKTQLMAWFIVIIMVMSVVGYVGLDSMSSESSSKITYNGFNFVNYNNQWLLRSGTKEYYFQYTPAELENITLSTTLNFNSQKIYLGFDPNETLSFGPAFVFLRTIFSNQGIITQEACLTEQDCPDVPLLDCQNNLGIIIISGEINGYTEEEKCLRIVANDYYELEKLVERLAYKILGVLA